MPGISVQIPIYLDFSASTNANRLWRAMWQEIDVIGQRFTKIIQSTMREWIKGTLIFSDLYRELTPGSHLHGEIGIPNIQERLLLLFDILANNVRVHYNNKRKSVLPSWDITAIRADYSDILNVTSISIFEYEGKAKNVNVSDSQYIEYRGGTIPLPWLSWFLTRGTDEIISHFYYGPLPNKAMGRSRTGMGIMRNKAGSKWSIKADSAGTLSDNFISRAIDPYMADLEEALRRALDL